MPGDTFTKAAYFCSKDCQIRIPGELRDFFAKTSMLSGVSVDGSSSAIVVKSPIKTCGDLNIAKADFGSGTYKIWNSFDKQRCIYVATATLSALQGLTSPLSNLYNDIDVSGVEEDFDKLVITISNVGEVLDTFEYQMLEAEMFQHPQPGVNMGLFCETISNFKNFFYRQVRNHLNQQ